MESCRLVVQKPMFHSQWRDGSPVLVTVVLI